MSLCLDPSWLNKKTTAASFTISNKSSWNPNWNLLTITCLCGGCRCLSSGPRSSPTTPPSAGLGLLMVKNTNTQMFREKKCKFESNKIITSILHPQYSRILKKRKSKKAHIHKATWEPSFPNHPPPLPLFWYKRKTRKTYKWHKWNFTIYTYCGILHSIMYQTTNSLSKLLVEQIKYKWYKWPRTFQ